MDEAAGRARHCNGLREEIRQLQDGLDSVCDSLAALEEASSPYDLLVRLARDVRRKERRERLL